MAKHAPMVVCGWCGSEIYGVGELAFCPVCKTPWEIAEWYIPPKKGSEKWLKYHYYDDEGRVRVRK